MSVADELFDAIRARRVVEMEYRSDPPSARRVVQPHIAYLTSHNEVCVDGYQIDGPTTSGPLPGWRLFDVSKINAVTVREEEFDLAPGYNPAAARYRAAILARAK
jgi:predicted DNA-binding transcriptional regulator YafY